MTRGIKTCRHRDPRSGEECGLPMRIYREWVDDMGHTDVWFRGERRVSEARRALKEAEP